MRAYTVLCLFAYCTTAYCNTAIAAEPDFVARFVVKVVNQGETTELQTELAGTTGQPLTTTIGRAGGITLDLKLADVAGRSPRQYVANFRLTNGDAVLSCPTITALAGQRAEIFVGEERGDQIKIELMVMEDR